MARVLAGVGALGRRYLRRFLDFVRVRPPPLPVGCWPNAGVVPKGVDGDAAAPPPKRPPPPPVLEKGEAAGAAAPNRLGVGAALGAGVAAPKRPPPAAAADTGAGVCGVPNRLGVEAPGVVPALRRVSCPAADAGGVAACCAAAAEIRALARSAAACARGQLFGYNQHVSGEPRRELGAASKERYLIVLFAGVCVLLVSEGGGGGVACVC